MQTHEQSSWHESASSILSNTVGNQIKQNVNDVNCDKMSDRAV